MGIYRVKCEKKDDGIVEFKAEGVHVALTLMKCPPGYKPGEEYVINIAHIPKEKL